MYTMVQTLNVSPPITSSPVMEALKAPICTIGGRPDASHITVGISPTNNIPPSR